jgi:inner membrane protein
MASAFSHAFVALALGKASHHPVMTWQVVLLGMACSIVPDLDVIGFSFGIRYGDLWGHRGLTHSLFFACLLSATLVRFWYWRTSTSAKTTLCVYFFFCTASHGVLDAMTDGGLGSHFSRHSRQAGTSSRIVRSLSLPSVLGTFSREKHSGFCPAKPHGFGSRLL